MISTSLAAAGSNAPQKTARVGVGVSVETKRLAQIVHYQRV